MLKFLIGVLTGVIFAVVIAVIAIFAIAYSFGRNREKPAAVANGSTLVLRLDGPIPERQPVSYDLPIFKPRLHSQWKKYGRRCGKRRPIRASRR